jgi:hypothetical protein
MVGGTASGKTSLARKSVEIVGSGQTAIIELDRHCRCRDKLTQSERELLNYDPLRYTQGFFAKFNEVAARISSTGAEDIFETGSNRSLAAAIINGQIDTSDAAQSLWSTVSGCVNKDRQFN